MAHEPEFEMDFPELSEIPVVTTAANASSPISSIRNEEDEKSLIELTGGEISAVQLSTVHCSMEEFVESHSAVGAAGRDVVSGRKMHMI